ncbi:cytochrome b [Rubellimicrobium aerolatum]|uniref:Cytochrome b n=1 Tax=Rubellimicrobium aerolatum TaxID=490979 RepID=A0ABW0SFB8_9RHOB|nr:cytochrome b [Rubellimicrobium aerolatum]MBP1807173.1 cytochrome b561 [Rubellimicrobium aerolatum]
MTTLPSAPGLAPAYGPVSRLNHWITAVVMLAMLGLGFTLAFVELGEARRPVMNLHKAVGTLFLALALWRVLWRLACGFPPEPEGLPRWQSLAARATHWLLLAGILLMPLSGLLMSLFGGRPVDLFGLATIPALAESEAIAGAMNVVHGLAAYGVAALVVLHVAAALKHHLIDRDGVLARMAPGA